MNGIRSLTALLFGFAMVCGAQPSDSAHRASNGPVVIEIPQGSFIAGSNRKEREYAYTLDERAYGHNNTRKWEWYENERELQAVEIKSFKITKNLITNAQYAAFIRATGHRPPGVDRKTWKSYGLIHPYQRSRRHAWRDGVVPKGRENHPVVMVSFQDAMAYAGWLSKQTGHTWRLPRELEWEKAARGVDGSWFPWGNTFEATLANRHDKGPFDTLPVGRFPKGASPYGLLDGAGQVFEWTEAVPGKKRAIVKGGSWDDRGCGICRPAARHTRPMAIKHILIGFRLVLVRD